VGGRTGGRVVVLEKWVTAKEGTAEERGAADGEDGTGGQGERDRGTECTRPPMHTRGEGARRGNEDEGEGELRTGRSPLSTSGTLWERRKASYAMQLAAAEARRKLSGRCRDALLGWRWDGTALVGMAAGWALLWAVGCWAARAAGEGPPGATLAVRRAAITRTTATHAAALIRAFPPVLARGASSRPHSLTHAHACYKRWPATHRVLERPLAPSLAPSRVLSPALGAARSSTNHPSMPSLDARNPDARLSALCLHAPCCPAALCNGRWPSQLPSPAGGPVQRTRAMGPEHCEQRC
jgi:hypothetical protein